ncbi:MAG: long-chain fatty acid--CoA ligase, partial [Deltaproteobacteria bacterium]
CLTSGTTGKPKLCYFDQEHSRLNARLHCESLGINSNHTLIQTLPLYHSFGLISYYYSWLEKKFTLDLNPIFLGFKSLSKRELSSAALHVSPSQLRFMLKEKTDPPKGIDLISIGGGSVDSTSLNDIREKLPTTKIYVTYGLTEAGPRATTGLWNDQEEGYIGKSLEQIQVGVLYHNQIETSGIGRLCLQTPTLKLNPSADEMKGNWLVTRDHVEINAEGEIYFKGREDDLINFGGISLYPSDIETVVRSNQEVHDCVVLKVQSETYEEEPLLVIEPIIDTKEMRTYLKDKLAAGQIPRKIESMEKLPRTSLEKVDRKELSKMLGIA